MDVRLLRVDSRVVTASQQLSSRTPGEGAMPARLNSAPRADRCWPPAPVTKGGGCPEAAVPKHSDVARVFSPSADGAGWLLGFLARPPSVAVRAHTAAGPHAPPAYCPSAAAAAAARRVVLVARAEPTHCRKLKFRRKSTRTVDCACHAHAYETAAFQTKLWRIG